MDDKVTRTGIEAARRKFTPEFMNRLDKIVVFRPLGRDQLERVLDIELGYVQQRVFSSNPDRAFVFALSDSAKEYLLCEGTDVKYGARHLKRSIERLLVQPLSNLIATDQVRGGDFVRIDRPVDGSMLSFAKEAEGLPMHAMIDLLEHPVPNALSALANAVGYDAIRPQNARTSRRS
jgi:ATP-dependent Clp protease ATP-binding subunit ClpA